MLRRGVHLCAQCPSLALGCLMALGLFDGTWVVCLIFLSPAVLALGCVMAFRCLMAPGCLFYLLVACGAGIGL